MTSDIDAAAQQAAAFMAGKKKADETAFMLAQVLAMMDVRVGDRRSWPQLAGRASLSGEPSVYLGTVPMETVKKLIEALIYAESAKRYRWSFAPVADEVSAPVYQEGSSCPTCTTSPSAASGSSRRAEATPTPTAKRA
ncbi:hypothetical protein [Streptomyces huiliensis]|uniref:hypothetical protein n=1 Tax=Streptomyces huiliensis TaxID=2876027 RepID=UPI001CBCBAAB|nr:hypothetical protein [Streptomyces huiliensis]MBZ4318991.1 hypothetical protein [Streptomyces huiliensis]